MSASRFLIVTSLNLLEYMTKNITSYFLAMTRFFFFFCKKIDFYHVLKILYYKFNKGLVLLSGRYQTEPLCYYSEGSKSK